MCLTNSVMLLKECYGSEGENVSVRSSDIAGKKQRPFETISTSSD